MIENGKGMESVKPIERARPDAERALGDISAFAERLQGEPGEFAEESKRALETIEHQPTILPNNETAEIVRSARTKLDSLDGQAIEEAKKANGKWKELWKKRLTNPIFLTGIVSAIAHGAIIAKGMEVPDDVKKELPQMVLQPQSVDDMLKISLQRAEREKHIDRAAVVDYKRDIRERIEKGEQVSFEELYLDMEQLNGVPAETVEQAKQKAHADVDHYAENMADGISEDELRQFVNGMYGSNENYDWGQASVSKYFTTGKRNCVAIAKAEAVVLEGVLNRMAPEERSRYEIGINKLKQHEVATLTVHDREGRGFRTYLLEGEVTTLENATEEVGTKTIPLEDVKKAMVAEKPVTVQAASEKGKPIEASPDLITDSDQPVNDGVVVEGPLKGSAYVMEQAKLQGVEPVKLEQGKWGPTEIEILDEEPPASMMRSAVLSMWGLGIEEGRKHGLTNFTVSLRQAMETGPFTASDVRSVYEADFPHPPTTYDFGEAHLLDESAQEAIAKLLIRTKQQANADSHKWIVSKNRSFRFSAVGENLASARRILELMGERQEQLEERHEEVSHIRPNVIVGEGDIGKLISSLKYHGRIRLENGSDQKTFTYQTAMSIEYESNFDFVELSGFEIPEDALEVLARGKRSIGFEAHDLARLWLSSRVMKENYLRERAEKNYYLFYDFIDRRLDKKEIESIIKQYSNSTEDSQLITNTWDDWAKASEAFDH